MSRPLLVIGALLAFRLAGDGADPLLDTAVDSGPVSATEPRLFEFRPGEAEPFQLNKEGFRLLTAEENRLAAEKYASIQSQMADLILEFPESPAAQDALRMLDKSGLRVFPDGSIHPRGTFYSVVPILR